MKVGLLFPGQASQYVGMGVDLRRLSDRAAHLFLLAEERLGLPLADVCERGPAERLTLTEFAQPAVVATSLAAWTVLREALEEEGLELEPACAAGHSVGELAALAAAEVLEPADALELVAVRAHAMAQACRQVDGSMAAVLGLDAAQLADICRRASDELGTIVQVANLNSHDQIVLSGERRALARAEEHARAAGARRVIPLQVAGPFHSAYMRPAVGTFAARAADTPFRRPAFPVVQNATARAESEPAAIRAALVEQIAAPVRWTECVERMVQAGCDWFLELGPGQVLSGLVRRLAPGARTLNVQDEASLRAALDALRSGLERRESAGQPDGQPRERRPGAAIGRIRWSSMEKSPW